MLTIRFMIVIVIAFAAADNKAHAESLHSKLHRSADSIGLERENSVAPIEKVSKSIEIGILKGCEQTCVLLAVTATPCMTADPVLIKDRADALRTSGSSPPTPF